MQIGLFVARSAPTPAVIAIKSVKIDVEVYAKTSMTKETNNFRKEKSPIEILTSPAHKLITKIKRETSSKLVSLLVNPRTISASKMIMAQYMYSTPNTTLTITSTGEFPLNMAKTM